jgi:pilus assembly protein CpaD
MIKVLMVVCLGVAAAGCASHGADGKLADAPPITPTQQFAIKVAPAADEILLAPHRSGLSARQAAALDNLVDRWRDAGGGEITLQRPPADTDEVEAGADAIRTRLTLLGVDPDDIRVVRYGDGERPRGVLVVSFVRQEAQRLQCGRDWKSFTKSYANAVSSNFGCATTANLAAMVDNPADLVGPQPMSPVDASRREDVVDKYRKGLITSSAKDEQAAAKVSDAVQ